MRTELYKKACIHCLNALHESGELRRARISDDQTLSRGEDCDNCGIPGRLKPGAIYTLEAVTPPPPTACMFCQRRGIKQECNFVGDCALRGYYDSVQNFIDEANRSTPAERNDSHIGS